MTTTDHAPGLDFEEWLNLRDRIIRMRKLARAAKRERQLGLARKYFAAARRAEKRMRVLERVAK